MILVDTSVWVAYFRGVPTREADRLDELLGAEPLAIGDLILLEVLQGFTSDTQFNAARKMLSRLSIVTLGGAEFAVRAARNYRALRARGITVRKTIDTLIATWCIENDFALLHADRDFEPFVKHLGLRSAL